MESHKDKLLRLWKARQAAEGHDVSGVTTLEEANHFFDKKEDPELLEVPEIPEIPEVTEVTEEPAEVPEIPEVTEEPVEPKKPRKKKAKEV